MNQPMMELPKYKSHKIVRALSIAAIEVHEDKSATIAPSLTAYAPFKTQPGWAERFKGNEDDKGYYVVYEDGYASWSPTKAFEEGYTKVRCDDIAASGMIHWKDLAEQLSSVWWELSKIGGTLQHGDLDKAETMFSVVLEQHGGKCFHGETPMDAWNKAKAWLMSPDRPWPLGPKVEAVPMTEATLTVVPLTFSSECDRLLCILQALIDSRVKRTPEEMQQLSAKLHSVASVVSKMELTEIQS